MRLGWLRTCWRDGVVVVVAPGAVVVLVVVPTTVVVVGWPDAAEPGSPVRTPQIVTAAPAAAATARDRAARERTTARDRPDRNHQLFMPVPECD